MLIPAVISILLFGASFLVFTAYYFWKQYSLDSKIYITESQCGNVNPGAVNPTKAQPEKSGSEILNESQYIQSSDKNSMPKQIETNSQQDHGNDEQEQEKRSQNGQGQNNLQNSDIVPTNRNSIEPSSQIINHRKEAEDFYKKIQNAYLLISCLVLGQAVISRIVIVKLNQTIHVKDYFYLSAINACLATILYNVIYGLLIFAMKRTFVRITLLRFGLICYGLVMPFALYNGLSNEISNDFLIVLIAIGYSIILQGCLQKCKNSRKIISETELLIV